MNNKFKKILLTSSFSLSILFAGCSQKQNSIVGTWISDDDEVISFDQNGSCDIPWAYSGAWMESADSYVIKSDGTLLLNSPTGHADDKFTKTTSMEEAEDNKSTYYLSGDTLVIDGDVYTRN